MTTIKVSRCQGVESLRTLFASSPLRSGFTLVEMVIVIGIIVLLVGLTVAVLGTLTRSSETRRTEDALKLIDTAYQEWKNLSERDVTYGIANNPTAGVVYDITQDIAPGDADDHEATDELIGRLLKNAQAKDILANINATMLKQHAGPGLETTLLDAWDTEVVTVFPGRLWNSATDGAIPKDEDGTIRTEFEQAFGICVNRRVRFVSAGPDGRFGNLAFGSPTQADYDDAKDNLYSYPLEAP